MAVLPPPQLHHQHKSARNVGTMSSSDIESFRTTRAGTAPAIFSANLGFRSRVSAPSACGSCVLTQAQANVVIRDVRESSHQGSRGLDSAHPMIIHALTNTTLRRKRRIRRSKPYLPYYATIYRVPASRNQRR